MLRPLSVGELIDRSATLWRANWRTLFQLMLGFQLAQYAMAKSLEVLLRKTMREALNGAAFDPVAWLQAPPQLDARAVATVAIAGAAFAFSAVLLSQVTGVALSAYIYPKVVPGPQVTAGEAVLHAMRRLGASVGIVLLSIALAALMGLFFFAPALVLGAISLATAKPWLAVVAAVVAVTFSFVALVLWYVLRFILTAQVTAIEPLGPWGIFRRTGALSSGRVGPGFMGWVKGRLTILITIVFGILFLVSALTGLPAILLTVMYGTSTDPTREAVPLWLLVPAELLQVAASALIDPIYVVFQVLFYVDMRVRREGLDFEVELKK